MNGKLLEDLSQSIGVFISSLKNRVELPRIVPVLERLSGSNYSLEEWAYCLSYIFDEPIVLQNTAQLEQCMETLRKRASRFVSSITEKDAQ